LFQIDQKFGLDRFGRCKKGRGRELIEIVYKNQKISKHFEIVSVRVVMAKCFLANS